MSVIIKGMKLPLPGDVMVCALIDGKLQCSIVTRGKPIEWREVLEVPTPHGRLIDAEELSKVFDWKQLENSPDEKGQTLYLLGQTTIEAIREAPTIIEAEASE